MNDTKDVTEIDALLEAQAAAGLPVTLFLVRDRRRPADASAPRQCQVEPCGDAMCEWLDRPIGLDEVDGDDDGDARAMTHQ